eukprot:11234647-Karenia_brevis.AAC.1
MDTSDFISQELEQVLKKLRLRRSAGDDNIAPEFWHICLDSSVLFSWLLEFCNLVWRSEQIPHDWHRSQVACLFKKGDPSCPDNYRPISLLQIGYKIFSALILNRLKANGIDDKLWSTQFGFRPKKGSSNHAISVRLGEGF